MRAIVHGVMEKMAEEVQLQLSDDFYRDSFTKVIMVMISLAVAIMALIALAIYLYMNKPQPITFVVDKDWRLQAPVPVNQAYLSDAEVLQWVSDTFNNVFKFDFISYNNQLSDYQKYFTTNGWSVFLNHLNTYANYNNVQTYRLFVSSTPTGAPYIINKNLLAGRYAWWVQLPISIHYDGLHPQPAESLSLQVLVTRVSTLNNLAGVGIDNVIINKSKMNQIAEGI